MSIVNLSEVLVHLRLVSGVSDSQLALASDIHLKAEAAIKQRLGYNVETASYTEYYPKRDVGLWSEGVTRHQRFIHVDHRPVTAISQVDEDLDGYFGETSGAFSSTDTLTEGDDYVWPKDLDSDADNTADASFTGKLIRLNKGWPTAPGSIKVQYTAGWTNANIPQDLRMAVLMTVGNWYSRISNTGATGRIITQERLGDYSVSYLTGDEVLELPIPPQAESLLQMWKRPRL